MDDIIDAESKNKCAYEHCQCEVGFGQKYCSDYCSEAANLEEVELQCDCGHAPCALDEEEVKIDEARPS
jgi:hypothetical protein